MTTPLGIFLRVFLEGHFRVTESHVLYGWWRAFAESTTKAAGLEALDGLRNVMQHDSAGTPIVMAAIAALRAEKEEA